MRPKKTKAPEPYYVSIQSIQNERAWELLPTNKTEFGNPPTIKQKLAQRGWQMPIAYSKEELLSPFAGMAEASTNFVIEGDRPTSPISRPSTADPKEAPDGGDWELSSYGVLEDDEYISDPNQVPVDIAQTWTGVGGGPPVHVDKWRYFRIRISKLYGATSYKIRCQTKRSLLEISPVHAMQISFKHFFELETDIALRTQSQLLNSSYIEAHPITVSTWLCKPEPPSLTSYSVQFNQGNRNTTLNTSSNPNPNSNINEGITGLTSDQLAQLMGRVIGVPAADLGSRVVYQKGERENDMQSDRLLARVAWRKGYEWGAPLLEMEIARRLVPLEVPEFRIKYEQMLSKDKDKETAKGDKLNPDFNSDHDIDDDDASKLSGLSMGSAKEIGVSPEDLAAFIDTLPYTVLQSFDTSKSSKDYNRSAFAFSESLDMREHVLHIRSWIAQVTSNSMRGVKEGKGECEEMDMDPYVTFIQDVFRHVKLSGEGLGIQYRIRARNKIGWYGILNDVM
jgi:hypothetical protein